jgi:hypothetical protein
MSAAEEIGRGRERETLDTYENECARRVDKIKIQHQRLSSTRRREREEEDESKSGWALLIQKCVSSRIECPRCARFPAHTADALHIQINVIGQ